MKIKEILHKIKKGVKVGMAVATESNELTEARIVYLINKFMISDKHDMMLEGEKYYQVDNDIKNRRMLKKINGGLEEESWKANNKLAHAKYKSQVDEKIAYLLSKPVTITSDSGDMNDRYIEKIKNILGKHFQYQLP